MKSLVLLLPLVAVLSSGEEGRVAVGDWAGGRARLTVQKESASLELDCAHGSLEAMVLAKGGRFDVAGRFVRERGGPIRTEEKENALPARYRGSVQGETLHLEIVIEGGETVGPFELTLGGRARLMKCR